LRKIRGRNIVKIITTQLDKVDLRQICLA